MEAWCLERIKPDQREGWLAEMNAPLARPRIYGTPDALPAKPSTAELQADTDAFMAAMAANQGG